ncbi:MAG: sulfatase [Polyangia bacterium]|nr:sulfatase [Polyangia bacterium]
MTGSSEQSSLRWAERIANLLSSGPAVGAALAVALFAIGTLSLDKLSYLGHASDELRRLAIRVYGPQVAVEALRILAIYVAIGLVGGLLSSGLCTLRDLLRGRRPSSRLWRIGRHLILIGGLHAYFLGRAMVVHPQLFADAFYAKGGVRRDLQVILTDWVPPGLWDALLALALGLFVLLPARRFIGKLRAPRGLGPRALIGGGAALGLLVLAVGAASLSTAPRRAKENEGPNIVILAIDSLRADRLEDARYERVAPRMRRLSRQGVRFQSAYGTLARTFPSWVTLLTGREPHDHGIRHMFPSWEARRRAGLALPRHLANAGYRTAVVSDYAGEIFGRIDLGFHHVDVSSFSFYEIVRQRVISAHTHLLPYLATGPGRRLAPPMSGLPENADPLLLAERVKEMVDRVSRGKRFFLVAFFSSAHFPYAAPYPHYQRFTDRSYRGPYRYHKQRLLHEGPPSRADIDHMRGLYDGAVLAADEAIGRVLDHLERIGVAKNTIVVLTADHGENLYEPGLGMGHGDHLRGDSATRLPLVLFDPRQKRRGRILEGITRDVDLAPTLAALVGHPLTKVSGRDLGPQMAGQPGPEDRAAFMETGLWFTEDLPEVGEDMRLSYPPVLGGLVNMDEKRNGDLVLSPQYEELVVAAKHRAIRTKDWTLVYVPLRAGVRTMLYDMRQDPLCQRDVSALHPEMTQRLARRLMGWMREERGSLQVGSYVLPGKSGGEP